MSHSNWKYTRLHYAPPSQLVSGYLPGSTASHPLAWYFFSQAFFSCSASSHLQEYAYFDFIVDGLLWETCALFLQNFRVVAIKGDAISHHQARSDCVVRVLKSTPSKRVRQFAARHHVAFPRSK